MDDVDAGCDRNEKDPNSEEEEGLEDNEGKVVEGTPGYLPPEVLQDGHLPGQLADSWALGCTMEFCLIGRPPFFGASEQVLHQIFQYCDPERDHMSSRGHSEVVQFKNLETIESNKRAKRTRGLFSSSKAPTIYDESIVGRFDAAANSLLSKLISIDFRNRLSVAEAVHQPYLTGEDILDHDLVVNPLKWHFSKVFPTLPFLDGGVDGDNSPASVKSSAGGSEKEWARRQLSAVWAPMPHAYRMAHDGAGSATPANLVGVRCDDSPIAEGDEEFLVRFFSL